jgi:hypothetical protein
VSDPIAELQTLLERMELAMRVNQHTTTKTALWDKKDCAQYLRISLSSLEKMITANEFVNHRLSVSGSTQGNRWIPQDVIDWAQSKQFESGRPRAA